MLAVDKTSESMTEKILLIEDDKSIAELIALNLRMEGYEVSLALNASDGFDKVYEENPDLILCDVMLPDIDGYELCRRIKSDERVRMIPVIFLTARKGLEDKIAAMNAGGDDFISKPFEFEELFARIEMNLLRSHRTHDVDNLTHLPGLLAFLDAVEERLEEQNPFALLFVALKGLRQYRLVYGDDNFERVLKLAGEIIREVIKKEGSKKDFASLVGIGKLAVVTVPERADIFAHSIMRLFDQSIKKYYSLSDLVRGSITTLTRRGAEQNIPIMTVHIGGCSNATRKINSRWEAIEIADEVLEYSMRFTSSSYFMDRRKQ